MSRAVSPTTGDPDLPINSSFLPPSIQRLSRSLTSFSVDLSSRSRSASDLELLEDPSQNTPSPLPGPNRALSTSAQPSPSSSSSKPSNIFPRLHRLEIADDMGHGTKKSPLLELRLSSLTFLDAVAIDADSGKPLYVVETVGSSTTIWRSDPWDGTVKIAEIRWPKELPLKGKGRNHTHSATVQMKGVRWKGTNSLLRYSGLGSSRKFSIPHHVHALKWKKVGNTYTCTTMSCKGPVAILEYSNSDTPPTLKVFESLGFHASLPQLDHAGISLALLDNLFVTALLLVTEPDDWMTVARNPASLDNRPDAPTALTTGSLRAPTSNRQWRKIMYGQPLYPSLKPPGFEKGTAAVAPEDVDVLDISEAPQLSATMRQWRKVVYGEPMFPSLRPQSVDDLDLPSRPSTSTSFSSESGVYPPTPSSAPSPTSYDCSPLFDDPEGGMGRLVTREARNSRRLPSPSPFSPPPLSPLQTVEYVSPLVIPSARQLPAPPSSLQPPAASQPWLHRSRSSPRLSPAEDVSTSRLSSDSLSGSPEDDFIDRTIPPRLSISGSIRQLPSIPASRDTTPRSSLAPQRSLPPTPPLRVRSQSDGEHLQLVSHPMSYPWTTHSGSSTGQPGSSTQTDMAVQGRQRGEKDPNDVINSMRNISRAHRRRALEDEQEPVYEQPPPAYSAIDFSMPP